MKNIGKLNDIAPTVVFTWGKLDYLSQQIEIGKLLNKEKEAKENRVGLVVVAFMSCDLLIFPHTGRSKEWEGFSVSVE